jgi:hypothetical protein
MNATALDSYRRRQSEIRENARVDLCHQKEATLHAAGSMALLGDQGKREQARELSTRSI